MTRQPAFFERQPQHIQDLMRDMAQDSTSSEIISAMKERGVDVKKHNVHYYRLMHNVSCERNVIAPPAATFHERIGQYIAAIHQHNGEMFSNHIIGLKGQIWGRVTKKLCDEGIIECVMLRPARYVRKISDDEMDEWFDRIKDE